VIAGELAYVLPLGSDTADWVAQGRRAIALAPQLWMGHAFLGCAFIWDGRLTDAVAELETALRLDPRIPFAGALAYAYGKQGQSSRARAVLRELEAHGRERNGSPAQVALAYLGLGERDRALEWLARAVTARDPFLYSSPMYAPWFDDVRSDPRFTSLVRQMGLDPSALAYAAAHRASPLATP
jgi:tetratricopeptide (TPR) repeat protein